MNNRIQNIKKKRMDGLLKNGIPDLCLFAALVGFMGMQFGTRISSGVYSCLENGPK